MNSKTLINVFVALLFLLSCAQDPQYRSDQDISSKKSSDASGSGEASTPKVTGLSFRVEEGSAEHAGSSKKQDSSPTKTSTPAQDLNEDVVKGLFERVARLNAKKADKQVFSKRKRSLPPPRTGETIKQTFPPKQNKRPPKIEKEDLVLQVLRHSPDGAVSMAPELSVTFNLPMVNVTSHADAKAQNIPVRVSPVLEGTWRWKGTKTLTFEPKGRLPMATDYRVVIPAGTKGSIGAPLKEDYEFTFQTPAPKIVSFAPSGYQVDLDPLFIVRFDQKIDPKKIKEYLVLSLYSEPIPLRLASKAEFLKKYPKKAPSLQAYVEDGQTVFLRAKKALKNDRSYDFDLLAGAPSMEGPRTTETKQRRSFRTYPPFRFQSLYCDKGCAPSATRQLRFNNRIDQEAFEPEWVTVEPKTPGMKVRSNYRGIYIQGPFKRKTTYTVRVSDKLQDQFGQKLTEPVLEDFTTGIEPATLSAQGGDFVVLDPVAKGKFPIVSKNHDQLRVRMFQVESKHWNDYREFLQRGVRDKNWLEPPGEKLVDRIIEPTKTPDEEVETVLDLTEGLKNGRSGSVVLFVTQHPRPEKVYQRRYISRWVQLTEMAVDATVDSDEVLAWVTSIRDGSPIKNARVRLMPGGADAKTNADGLARIPLSKKGVSGHFLVAELGTKQSKDSSILPRNANRWGGHYGWSRSTMGKEFRWFVFDDRKLYKPKEEVRVKGWARIVDFKKGGQTIGAPKNAKVRFRALDSRGNQVAKGTAKLNKLGGFDFKFKLPDTANLGNGKVQLTISSSEASGTRHNHRFQIQEFRKPEFEVSASKSQGPFMVGGSAQVRVKAKYFSGGPLVGAQTSWTIKSRPGYFSPKNQDGFSFGTWIPWWRSSSSRYTPSKTQQHTGTTDSEGVHRLRLHFDADHPARPMSVTAHANIQDVNRQTWTANTALLVHPSEYYVGLKTERYFVEKGKPIEVDLVVADLDGVRVDGAAVRVQAVRVAHVYKKGVWETELKDKQTCEVVSAKDPVRCSFKTLEGGRYEITASVQDKEGRANQSSMSRWVSGGKVPPKRNVEREEVQLIPNKKVFEPGEKAEFLVLAPFSPAQGLLTVRRSGVVKTERFTMDGSSTTLSLPVLDEYLPNFSVQVDLVGAADRLDDDGEVDESLPKRPAFASGSLYMSVSRKKYELSVDVKPEVNKLAPGEKTSLLVSVTDAKGAPVSGADVSLVVVDEAVLALTGYAIGSPLTNFIPYRSADTSNRYFREMILLADPLELKKEAAVELFDAEDEGVAMEAPRAVPNFASPTGAGGAKGKVMRKSKPKAAKMSKPGSRGGSAKDNGQPKIAVRKDFRALALYEPSLTTDKNGQVRVTLKVPDSLTRYRVMAVAVSGRQSAGSGSAEVTARLPLMVRQSPPRFLNFGDHFELPVVVQNQTDKPMLVQVAVRGTNVDIKGGGGKEVSVPANDRVEVRFPSSAVEAGIARFQVVAVSGKWSDASEFSLPVWTPATSEAFATYGTTDGAGIVQPVSMPRGVFPQFGGLEVTTSSTQLQALTDAVLYLATYRFDCAEQRASRVLAIASLRDVLSAFQAKGLPAKEELLRSVSTDMKELKKIQNQDGGFGFWRYGERSWPFLTIHVGHAMVRAKSKGFTVPPNMYHRIMDYLKNIEARMPTDVYYTDEVKRVIVAYSLYVRALASDVDGAKASSVVSQAGGLDKLPLEAVAWMYPVFSKAGNQAMLKKIRRLINNKVTEEAGTAHFVTGYSDGGHLILHSNRRIDGLLLEGLLQDQPKSDLIPKIVKGLLAHRTKGRWGNTQENAWVLLALDKYFHVYEGVTPNFVADVWLGKRYAGGHKFRGRTTERHHIDIPMKYLDEVKQADLTIGKKGAGRVYYRIGMRYAPKDLKLPAESHGFSVTRSYEAMDDPADVTQDEDGTWRIKAGARVRVRLSMHNKARRYHVALVDPLPAGLEPLNAALLGTDTTAGKAKASSGLVKSIRSGRRGRAYRGRRSYRRYWGTWFRHQNLRDERAEAFTSYLWAGVHEYTYTARATTPGTFVAPPSKAEEMYHPEVFGRSQSDRVVVVE